MVRPSRLSWRTVSALTGSRLFALFCSDRNMKSKSWTSTGGVTAKASGISVLASATGLLGLGDVTDLRHAAVGEAGHGTLLCVRGLAPWIPSDLRPQPC